LADDFCLLLVVINNQNFYQNSSSEFTNGNLMARPQAGVINVTLCLIILGIQPTDFTLQIHNFQHGFAVVGTICIKTFRLML
jgi:hypothetical protein